MDEGKYPIHMIPSIHPLIPPHTAFVMTSEASSGSVDLEDVWNSLLVRKDWNVE